MTPEERYRFDIQGYLVRRSALSSGDIEALNVAVDVLGVPEPGDDIMSQRFVNHLTAARRFRDLLDRPGILQVPGTHNGMAALQALSARYMRVSWAILPRASWRSVMSRWVPIMRRAVPSAARSTTMPRSRIQM